MTRDEKEMKNLFSDPKFSRQAWQSVGRAILQNPASKPIPMFDKDGNETLASQIERYNYQRLSQDIAMIKNPGRTEPTELEMILACQIVKARFDTTAAAFVRDTLGAKPVDESKTDLSVNNPYESLTDEELEMLQQMREKKAIAEQHPETLPDTIADTIAEKVDDNGNT